MTRTLRRFVAVLVVALALVGVFASCAYATLEDTPTPTLGTSGSNPGWGPDSWWRGDWGNTLYPDFELNPPSVWSEDIDGYLLGTIYQVDRTNSGFRSSYINTTTPGAYDRDTFPTGVTHVGGSLTANTLDMLGTWIGNPGGLSASGAGITSPLEGAWYYHYSFYSNFRYQMDSYEIPFGIDITPPRAVTGLRLSTSVGGSAVTTWTPATRAVISWDASETDSLSGTGYYQVLLDDKPYVPEASSTPTLGRLYNMPGPALPPNAITIENVPPGAHKLSIQVVDRATNVSPAASTYFYSDPDTPTISWSDPVGNSIDPRSRAISVNASDLAGDPLVTISLGTSVTPSMFTTTVPSPPYTFTPDLSSLATGTYTITATARDHLNRTETISKPVVWSPNGIAGTTSDASIDPSGTALWSADSADSGETSWTNNLYPIIQVNPSSKGTDIFYDVAQTPTDLDTLNLQNYLHSVWPYGTMLDFSLSLKDSIDSGGPWAAGPTGSVAPYEGSWYFQMVWFNHDTLQVSPVTHRLKFNIDRTPPAAVNGFTATPAAGVWTTSRRVTLNWTSQQYDALSGDALYNIYLDGSRVATAAPNNPFPSATIENMPAGTHRVSIAAQDKAGNVGPMSDLYFKSDWDIPTIQFVEPTSTLTPRNRAISVVASDAAGDPSVAFAITGASLVNTVTLGTVNAPPYAIAPDLSSLANGAYTLHATATDGIGNTRTVTRDIILDNTVTLATDPAVDLADGASIGTSHSNPGLDTQSESWWRQGWGNSLTPDFELNAPSPVAETYGLVVGTLYSVTTTPQNVNPNTPDLYYRSARGSGTNMNQTIDLQGVFNYPPVGGWRPTPLAGATLPIEGPWYMNLRWFTSKGYASTRTYSIPMGIDLTPPLAVDSMVVSPSLNPADATETIPTSRIHISWAPHNYDTLSGVAYYQVYIDGVAAVPESASNPAQGRIYNIPGASPNSVTIENLPAGRHTIGLAAVDRATNVGPVTQRIIYSDPDVPTISITSPSGSVIGVKPTVSANAADQGGVVSVVFKLDGAPIATRTQAPYSAPVDLSAFSTGLHTLTATVTDHYGRQVTDSRQVSLDKTPLIISAIKTKTSGRKITVSYSVNRSCATKLALSVAKVTKSAAAATSGKFSFTYTYPKGKKYPSALSFKDTYTLSASDSLGNVVSYTSKVSVLLAKIVKLAHNKVKIVTY